METHACGCPIRAGHVITDSRSHEAFHALVHEQTGIAGPPTADVLQAARGLASPGQVVRERYVAPTPLSVVKAQSMRVLRAAIDTSVDGSTTRKLAERTGLPLAVVRDRVRGLVTSGLLIDSGDTTVTAEPLWLATLAGITESERTS